MARKLLAAVTALLTLLSASLAYYYQFTGLLDNRPGVIYGLGALCAALIAATAWGGDRVHKGALFALYLAAVLEGALQVLALLGLLPVHTYEFAPYSRVYTQTGNSITNRWGWYAPPFALREGSRRIAVIGDSYIHAPDVNPREHLAVRLQELMRADGSSVEVFPLGISGTGPAYYLELLKYAKERLGASEAVIFVTLINDFMNSSRELMNPWWTPAIYVYYRLREDGRVELDPASAPALRRLHREWELNHRSLFWSLGRTFRSHVLLEKAVKVPLDRWRQRKPAAAQAPAAPEELVIVNGGDRGLFVTPMSPEVRKAVAVGTGALGLCVEYAEREGIDLRIAAIPAFPPKFYETYEGKGAKDWSLRFGKYDFEAPERLVLDFAKARGVPALGLTRLLRERRMPPEEIRPLMFGGMYHFTPAGHDHVARALHEAFFRR